MGTKSYNKLACKFSIYFFFALLSLLSCLYYFLPDDDPQKNNRCLDGTVFYIFDILGALYLLLSITYHWCDFRYEFSNHAANSCLVTTVIISFLTLFSLSVLVVQPGCYAQLFESPGNPLSHFDSRAYIVTHIIICSIFCAFIALFIIKIILVHVLGFFGLFGFFDSGYLKCCYVDQIASKLSDFCANCSSSCSCSCSSHSSDSSCSCFYCSNCPTFNQSNTGYYNL